MKIAVIGSQGVFPSDGQLEIHLSGAKKIVSGGAHGADECASNCAMKNNIFLVEILPDYKRYGRGAPIIRNRQIVDCADKIVAFWDGQSKGTLSTIKYAEKIGKECSVIIIK